MGIARNSHRTLSQRMRDEIDAGRLILPAHGELKEWLDADIWEYYACDSTTGGPNEIGALLLITAQLMRRVGELQDRIDALEKRG